MVNHFSRTKQKKDSRSIFIYLQGLETKSLTEEIITYSYISINRRGEWDAVGMVTQGVT